MNSEQLIGYHRRMPEADGSFACPVPTAHTDAGGERSIAIFRPPAPVECVSSREDEALSAHFYELSARSGVFQ